VTFDIDADGIVNVGAKDKATNRDQSITLTASSGLSDKEIEKMVQEAETFSASDKERKEVIEATNHADGLMYETEKNMNEFKDQLSTEEMSSIKGKISELREFVNKANEGEEVKPDELKAKTEELKQSSLKMFEMVYKARMQQQDSGDNKSESSGSGEQKQ
jgi:molecular chaperone DnaK